MSAVFVNLLLKFLDLAPRYLIAIAVLAAFLLFGPDRVLKYLGIDDFAQHNRPWLGLSFVVSVALSLAYWGEKIVRVVWDMILHKKAVKNVVKYLNTLTEEEKQILRFYVAKQTKTNYLCISDGVAQSLVTAGIIGLAAPMSQICSFAIAYNISDLAWNYLNEHKSLLLGTTNRFRNDRPEDLR